MIPEACPMLAAISKWDRDYCFSPKTKDPRCKVLTQEISRCVSCIRRHHSAHRHHRPIWIKATGLESLGPTSPKIYLPSDQRRFGALPGALPSHSCPRWVLTPSISFPPWIHNNVKSQTMHQGKEGISSIFQDKPRRKGLKRLRQNETGPGSS